MAMKQKTVIDSIDVSAYLVNWNFDSEWGVAIDEITIELSSSISAVLALETGQEVVITRGFTTSTDEGVFSGQITQVKPFATTTILICKNPLNHCIRNGRVKSWDKDIDTEGGVGSEIFKTILDHSSIGYDSTSITSTGTVTGKLITKFIQNDEDDYEMLVKLAKLYDFMISYDYDNDWAEFKPKGYLVYTPILNVGIEIQNQLKWKENLEQLINKVKIQGATVYDKIVETFAGAATTFTLSKVPEDSEVRINHAGADTLQTRGQKGIGTIGTDYDYYLDTQQKTLTFSGDVSDVWINYGAQVPMPVVLKNTTSIETYGGANNIPAFKKFTFNDIIDVDDATNRGRAILAKYSTPFIEVEKAQINDSVIIANGNIKPGYVVRIIDAFNNKDKSVFVKKVYKNWPHIGDQITVGDEIWRTEDWQAKQMEKINLLFNELNKNEGILITTFDTPTTMKFRKRYHQLQTRDTSGDSIWGRGFGNGTTDSLEWNATGGVWQDTYTNALVTVMIVPGDNIYKEFVKDTTFRASSGNTATWNTTTQQITFTSGQVAKTGHVALGFAYSYFTLTLASTTGTLVTEISADNGVSYQTVTLGARTAFLSSDGTGIIIRITESAATTASILNTYDAAGNYNAPVINLILEV